MNLLKIDTTQGVTLVNPAHIVSFWAYGAGTTIRMSNGDRIDAAEPVGWFKSQFTGIYHYDPEYS